MKKLILLAMALLIACTAEAAELVEGKVYKLEISLPNLQSINTGTFTAARASKFKVIDSSATDNYVVRFITVQDFKSRGQSLISTVREDDEYLLPKKVNGVDIAKSATESISGPVSGPLIVPFKYRLNNKTLTGDATLGYYAGYSVSVPVGGGTRIPFTPILSAGLSQIGISNGGETTNKSALTWTAGLLIQNWGNVNIGVLYGEDRVGDATWESEGKGWVSFMVGWNTN